MLHIVYLSNIGPRFWFFPQTPAEYIDRLCSLQGEHKYYLALVWFIYVDCRNVAVMCKPID